jgi:hypothetical protein
VIVPTLGKVTCLRSPLRRGSPVVVNRTLGVVRRRARDAREPNPCGRHAWADSESAQFLRRTGYTVQACVERLCAALTAPRGDLGFGGVPGATQARAGSIPATQ